MLTLSRIWIVLFVVASVAGCDNSVITSSSPKQDSELEKTIQSAEGGNVTSMMILATRFDSGEGEKQDKQKAFQWFSKAAQAGSANAMLEVSKRFFSGTGTERNLDKGKEWRRQSAEAGNTEAQWLMARQFGMVLRSDVLIIGDGLKEEKTNATAFIDWLTKSSSNNYLPAKHELAMIRLLGAKSFFPRSGAVLVAPDVEAGLALLGSAAEGGYWKSQWALAVLYQSGYDKIAPDKSVSEKWWSLLEKHDDSDTQYQIGNLYDELDRNVYKHGRNKWRGQNLSFEETNKIAAEWYEKAVAKGHADASFRLGQLYMSGFGVYKDEAKAVDLWKKASDKGVPRASYALGMVYLEGKGVPRDYARAHELITAAAISDDYFDSAKARNAVGVMHEYGYGVETDLVMAYAWYNIAATGGYAKSKQNIARVEKKLKSQEIQEAQALTRDWKPGKSLLRMTATRPGSKPVAGQNLKHYASGTGFLVTTSGDILTNYHVVADCKEIRVPVENKVVQMRVGDKANDLALLKIESNYSTSAVIADPNELRQGDDVTVFGFPLDGFLPISGNITTGIVSALAGPGNNASLVQITAAVQLGNSGGPAFNRKGHVVGVVVGKADAIKIARVTGDMPQNINFAIAGSTVRAFLDGNRVSYDSPKWWSLLAKSSADIAAQAQQISMKIECWQ